MKVLEPSYYSDFKCSAGECRDSCCIGWHVFIDKKSFIKYKKVGSEFGKELKRKIRKRRKKLNDNEYGETILFSDGRCSLLNKENLCDLYINEGEDYLCRTCKTFPRLINIYDSDIIERNLTLSCPVVAEKLVKMNMQFEFIMEDKAITGLDMLSGIKWSGYSEKYELFSKTRDLFIDIAQFQEIPIWKRLIYMYIAKDRIKYPIESFDKEDVDYKIQAIRQYVVDLDNIILLDDVVDRHVEDKISMLLDMIIKINEGTNYLNTTFNRIIGNVIEFAEKATEKGGFFEEKENEFDKYFEDKEIILENYLVWNLYKNYMDAMEDNNIDKIITNLIISYSMIKFMLISVWHCNNNLLNDDDIIDILYSYTKICEQQMDNIYDIIKVIDFDNLINLSILIY